MNLEEFNLKLDLNDDYSKIEANLCKMHCKFGFCANYEKKMCSKIHNTNLIINIEIIKEKAKTMNKSKNKTKKASTVVSGVNESGDTDEVVQRESIEKSESIAKRFNMESANHAHTSGIDAFMTGYSFVYFLLNFSNLTESLKTLETNHEIKRLDELNIASWLNNVYLTGNFFKADYDASKIIVFIKILLQRQRYSINDKQKQLCDDIS